jgi:hypothetical protein
MTSYLIKLILHNPKLNNEQLKTMVSIYINLGAICLGSIVIPSFFGQFVLYQVSAGLFASTFMWYTAIRISSKII